MRNGKKTEGDNIKYEQKRSGHSPFFFWLGTKTNIGEKRTN